ncbi:MAG: M28 family peptidase [Anaerolineae bacterium]|nr:M28 family peptidase [Anaerolineae bacterium]
MTDTLAADALMRHVRALADDIGPRPAGHVEEAQARDYIRRALTEMGIADVEEQPFLTWDTWGYSFCVPTALLLTGNAVGMAGRAGKLLGGIAALAGGYQLYQLARLGRQPLAPLFAKRPSANLIARIAPAEEPRHRVVLVGHTDSNKHRSMFHDAFKRALVPYMTLALGVAAANGLSLLAQAAGVAGRARDAQRATLAAASVSIVGLLADERGGYIDGANDNATAVACLLGLGAHLSRHPLQHTEVWLAFTGAEEVGCVGMNALLDAYGEHLADAWFIDFEMVGTEQIAYLAKHSSGSYLTGYAPDEESLAVAEETSRRYPELAVGGQEMVIFEEVGTLRGRGHRAICLAGVGEDGWLANWHRYDDNAANIVPSGMERAARFALAMIETIDKV